MSNPIVSVVMITYGHEKYIAQAIKGVLMQVCDFEIELIIANDFSPDKTDSVVEEIIDKHPYGNWIKYISHKENKGAMSNFIGALQQAKGKYIAMCEGDDYWTDSLKLQKQVDFLEENKEYSLVGHNAYKLFMNRNNSKELFSDLKKSSDISMNQIVNSWLMATASFVFRRDCILNLPSWFDKIYSGDLTLVLLLRHHGKVRFFSETMSVYRINLTGTSASATYGKSLLFGRKQHKILFEYFNEETNGKYFDLLNSKIKELEKEIRFLEFKEQGILTVILKMPLTSAKRIMKSVFFRLKNHA